MLQCGQFGFKILDMAFFSFSEGALSVERNPLAFPL